MDPLGHPIWNALTTRQQALTEGCRFGAALSHSGRGCCPFADTVDMSSQSLAALGAWHVAAANVGGSVAQQIEQADESL
jgi:hypothetical protein